MIPSAGAWVRDAWMAGLDVTATGVSLAGAVVLQVRWLAGLAGVWAVLALRQGWLAVRAFRHGAG
ncbi:hypothetical protein [Streptomyces sp. 351MFTsu5.1]|uniref:hypothetical protein n=1 Tax=Streptomyces sp. 351MFTsu5.1 TaxID=1172180 RepID=UPI0003820CF1|nr:hypothetical protein [Streptomyces sp. 351MFTsu5.1]